MNNIPQTRTSPRDGEEMQLVWHDEFEGNALDETKWNLFDRMWNKEKVTTTKDPENIAVENGEVVMRLHKVGEEKFTTNKTLTTWDRMSFRYGYLEIRARFSHAVGSWPGFWLQSAQPHRTVDYMTEIDIFELYKSGYMEATMHKWYMKPPTPSSPSGCAYAHDWNDPKVITLKNVETYGEEYHLYGFGWTPTEMYFTVDGEIIGVYDITEAGDFGAGLGNPGEKKALTGMGGFQDPVVINFTNWVNTTGAYKGSWKFGEASVYPFEFAVDWIRLYQKPGEGELNENDILLKYDPTAEAK